MYPAPGIKVSSILNCFDPGTGNIIRLMKSRYHVTSGGLVSLLLIPVLGYYSILFWLASFLIDVDHYLDYVFHNGFRDFSIRNMFVYNDRLHQFSRGRDFIGISILHTAEFVLAVYIASELLNWFWLKAILWGILFHMILDIVYLACQRRLFSRALSLIEYIIRWRSLKNRGLKPEEPYRKALDSMK